MPRVSAILLYISAIIIVSLLFNPMMDSARLNYWQMIPDATIESCLLERRPKMMQNALLAFLEVHSCLYWKKETIQLHRAITESGIMIYSPKPMGRLQWHWSQKTHFTSYVYLNNDKELGFNLSFSGFTMGYSGSECVYDRMSIQTFHGFSMTSQEHYCGITPDWNHITLVSSIVIAIYTTGEYPTSMQLVYNPVNDDEYERYDNIPRHKYVDREHTIDLGNLGDYSQYVQSIIYKEGMISDTLLVAVHARYMLIYTFVNGKLGNESVIDIYDGPFPDTSEILFTAETGLSDINPSLKAISGRSNGPVISVVYFRPLEANCTPISLKFQTRRFFPKVIYMKGTNDQQISSDDYCSSVNSITHCYFSIFYTGHSTPKVLIPKISNIQFTYKGPDIGNCLYGRLEIHFDYEFGIPVLSLCREDRDMTIWNIASYSNMISVLMYSYNAPISLTFTAGITNTRGNISMCNSVKEPLHQLFFPTYIYRFPVTGFNAGDKHCNLSVQFEGAVDVKVKRGKWSGTCTDKVRVSISSGVYIPSHSVANTSIEQWPLLIPNVTGSPGKRIRVEMFSDCRWSQTWVEIKAVEYCGETKIQELAQMSQVAFSVLCKSVQVPAISGIYRYRPFYSFPHFYNYKYHIGSDSSTLRQWDLKCRIMLRNLCLSVHIVRRDSRCPKACVNDTMKIRAQFLKRSYTDMDYASDLLDNITFIFWQKRHRRSGPTDPRVPHSTLYAKISKQLIYHTIYYIREATRRSDCDVCNIYHAVEVPARNSSYLLDTNLQYLEDMEIINPQISLTKLKDTGAVLSYQTKYHQYKIASLVNASWLSANTSCASRNLSLVNMAEEEMKYILTDIYSTANVWEFRKAIPILIFLGIQPGSVKVSLVI